MIAERSPMKTESPIVQSELPKKKVTDWSIIKNLAGYIWPKDNLSVKIRVILALSLLIGGKVRKLINYYYFVINTPFVHF